MNAQLPTLEELVSRAGRLYSLPAVATELLELTAGTTVDSQAVRECIEKDPALTAKLLQVVNSSLFGLSSKVGDLQHAVALLGTKPLKLLVLGFSLPEGLFAGASRQHLACYWRGALTKAVAAREICQSLWHVPGDESFLAGLLQDLGMLVLLQQVREPYVRLLGQTERTGDDLAVAERQLLGFDHRALSARLLDQWKLPGPLVGVLNAPMSTERLRGLSGPAAAPAQILHLAHLLVELVAQHRIAVLPELLEAGEFYCGLTRELLGELVASLETKVGQLADVLRLKLPGGRQYVDVLAEAHAQLADYAAEAAADWLRRPPAVELPCEHENLAVTVAPTARPILRTAPAMPSNESGAALVPEVPSDGCPAAVPGLGGELAAPAGEKSAGESSEEVLLGQLTAMVTCCRTRRCELSLLLVEVEPRPRRRQRLASRLGASWTQRIAQALKRIEHCEVATMALRARRFAVLLPDCDRHRAVAVAHQLSSDAGCPVGKREGAEFSGLVLRIGVATVAVPHRNFSARRLIESAERCLFAARAGSASTVKSIEVY